MAVPGPLVPHRGLPLYTKAVPSPHITKVVITVVTVEILRDRNLLGGFPANRREEGGGRRGGAILRYRSKLAASEIYRWSDFSGN